MARLSRRRSPAAGWLLIATILLLGAGVLPAQISVDIKATYFGQNTAPAPRSVTGASCMLSVTNTFASTVEPVVTIIGGDGVEYSVGIGAIAPGQTVYRHRYVPMTNVHRYSVDDEATNTSFRSFGVVSVTPVMPVAYIAPRAQALSLEDARELHDDLMPVGNSVNSYGPWRSGATSSYGAYAYPKAETFATSVDEIMRLYLPEEAPDNWQSLSVFREVLVPANTYATLSAEQKRALEDWVATGGILVILDPQAEPWEQRDLLNGMIVRTSSGFDILGTMLRPHDDMTRNPRNDHVDAIFENYFSNWAGYGGMTRGSREIPFFVESSDKVGASGAIVIATLFAIIAGPVMVYVLSRKKMVRLLYVAVPVLSLLFCGLIIVYFFISAGSVRTGGGVGLTIYDQRSGIALHRGQEMVVSGLFPLAGFQFGADSLALPLVEETNGGVDLTHGLHVQRGFFTPLVPFNVEVTKVQRTRERISLREEDGGLWVYNGLEDDLEKILIKRENSYYIARNIPKGGRARLERGVETTLRFDDDDRRRAEASINKMYRDMVQRRDIFAGTVYFDAIVAGRAGIAETGVDRRSIGEAFMAAGILDARDLPESWRNGAAPDTEPEDVDAAPDGEDVGNAESWVDAIDFVKVEDDNEDHSSSIVESVNEATPEVDNADNADDGEEADGGDESSEAISPDAIEEPVEPEEPAVTNDEE